MKKYIAIISALLAVVLSSCSNDDITIEKATVFKVYTNSVIGDFQEWKAGDLTVINSNYQLRVRLLVYDETGTLVKQDEQFFEDYAHVMTSNLSLSMGEKYKIVAMTDIVRKKDKFEYWELSGEESLKTLKISDTGYIASQNNILGIVTKDVEGGADDQINLHVLPAGTLMIIYYQGIFSWSDVTEYQLALNRSADYVTFDNSAQPEWNVNASSSYDWRISHIEVSDFEAANIYDYVFTLPYGNTNLRYEALTNSGWVVLTNSISLNIGVGSEYFILCDIENQTIQYEQLVSSRAMSDFSFLPSKSLLKYDVKNNDKEVSKVK